MHSAQELVAQVGALASLPSICLRIREQLDSADGSITEVARLVAADPALTARLLRVVNSALYGYGGQIETVLRAINILGLQQVHDLVLAISLGASLAGIRPERMDMARFWRGCVLCGLTAREIGRGCGLPSAERLFVIGLLADLGHLVLYQTVPALADEARIGSETGDESLDAAERRIIGCDHAEVGATLLDQWQLPDVFVDIVGAQLNPRLVRDNAYEAAIVHVATHVVRADRLGETSEDAAARIDPVIWSQLAMKPESLGGIRGEAELNVAGYVALLFSK
jgi:HD-like signal output (HDOD) protein